MRGIGERRRIEVDVGQEQAALLAGAVDDVDELSGVAPRALVSASLTMFVRRRMTRRCSSAFSVVWKGLHAHAVYISPLP